MFPYPGGLSRSCPTFSQPKEPSGLDLICSDLLGPRGGKAPLSAAALAPWVRAAWVVAVAVFVALASPYLVVDEFLTGQTNSTSLPFVGGKYTLLSLGE